MFNRVRMMTLAVLIAMAPHLAVAKLHLPHRQVAATHTGSSVVAQALRAADGNRWPEAHEIAERSGDPVLVKLIEWLDLSRPGTDASFQRIEFFVSNNPDWPGMGSLHKRGEDALPTSLEPGKIVAWFDAHAPQNPDNMPLYYDSLVRLNRQEEADRHVRELWVSGTFTSEQLREYYTRFGKILQRDNNVARTDRLLWDKAYLDARAMLPLLDRDDQAAANARIVLNTRSPGAEAAVAELPGDRQRDPGVLYARAAYAMAEQRDAEAAEILADGPAQPPHPAAWSTMRLLLARRLLESRDYKHAYKIAAEDRATEPSQIAESQFLAGWIALRFLGDAQSAGQHFAYMFEHVETPLSKSRAAYWAAQSQASPAGLTSEQWLQHSARYPTTFYGQLAAEALGKPLTLPPEPQPSPAETSHFEHLDVVRAARLLHQAGDANRVAVFMARLGEMVKSPSEAAETVRLARDLGSVPISVQIAKKALQNNIATLSSGYPVLGVHVHEPELALVHGIIRQESLFNPVIVSPSGAIGLMQLMPATAASEAKKLGVRSSTPQLSQNPSLNVTLGSGYLQQMIDNYGGSYMLAIAAYNGGPGRVRGWLQDIGDPRTGAVDPIDWIELIPVQETRNYVQRVLENVQVYRARLAGGSARIQIAEDLRR